MAINMTVDLGQVIFALAALTTAIFPVLSWLASKRNAKNLETVKAKVDAVHEQGNSTAIRMEEMAHSSGLAQGNLEGRAQQTAERKEEERR